MINPKWRGSQDWLHREGGILALPTRVKAGEKHSSERAGCEPRF